MMKRLTSMHMILRGIAVAWMVVMTISVMATSDFLSGDGGKGTETVKWADTGTLDLLDRTCDDAKTTMTSYVSDGLAEPGEAALVVSYVWTGGSGNWTDPTKWTPNGVPGAIDDATINSEITVMLTENEEVNHFTLGTASFHTLDGNFNLTINDDLVLGGFLYNGGNTTISGDFIWNAGQVGNSGTTSDVTVQGLTTIQTGVHYLLGKTLYVNGGAVQTSGVYITFDGLLVIPDGATYTANTPDGIGIYHYAEVPGSIDNEGLFHRTGTGNYPIASPIVFNNNGTIEVDAGTTITFVAGSTLNQNGVLKGEGTFNISGNFTQYGRIAPGTSVGELTISRSSLTNDTLEIEISGDAGPGTGHDRLNVTGNFIADGTLEVILLGGYVLAVNDAFQVLSTTGTVSGTFDVLDLPGDESEWDITYGANSITLTYLGVPECVPGGIIYVDYDAVGSDDGTNWANAFNLLQDALDVACDCESPVQIWVADGTYYPDEGVGQINNSLTSTFQLCNHVALYGGFAGNEVNIEDRDWVTHEAILSGDINGDALLSGNAYHVVTGSGTNNSAVLDGFSVTAGNSTADGGGVYNIAGSPSLRNCYIHSNNASIYGGGMYNELMSNPVVVNTIISGNSATAYPFSQGGGVYNIRSSPTFTNCVFSGNASKYGGGVFNTTSTQPSTPVFTNCTFSGNSSENGGGAIYNNISSYSTITNCIIWNNSNAGSTTTTSASIFGVPGVISYSLVANSGGSGAGWQPAIGIDGGNNIATDPLFLLDVNPLTAPTTAGNLRLQSVSPAIDTANTAANGEAFDLDGNTRVFGDDIDMGAYEFNEGPCENTWYADSDEDGLGDPDVSEIACEAPVGYVANDDDCDDTNDQIGGATTWYADEDGDGLGDPDVSTQACEASVGYVANADDCDDTDDQIGGPTTWYADADSDGLGDPDVSTEACEAPIGNVANADDCDDTDDQIGGPTTWYADADSDGLGDQDVSTEACEAPVGYVANADDCDDTDDQIGGPTTWYADADEDGFGDTEESVMACEPPLGYVDNDEDCDDSDPQINPDANEVCNGIDDDCDDLVDSEDDDVSGLSGMVSIGVSGDYHSLTETGAFGLFEAINTLGLSGDLLVEILDAAIIETGAVALNEISSTGCAAGPFTLTIKPGAGVMTVLYGSHATALIDLNGADHVIIDGSNNSSDSKDMIIRNASTTGNAIRFINGATQNTVKNAIAESANSSFFYGSVILFWTSPGPDGNSNNLIHNCDIRDLSNAPSVLTNGVFSNDNEGGAPNVNNTISACNIFNWTRRGVHLFSDNWTVSSSSFYQTAPRSTMLEAIELSGNGHQVLDNYIGGSEPLAEGSFMATTNIFRGISLGGGTGVPFSVQGNTIKNIRSTYVGYSSSYGIFLYYGSANIGTIEGNTIGSSDINERVEANGDGFGIRVTSTFSANVSNNTISHFGTNNSPAAAQWFSGISIEGTGGTHIVENNTITHVKNTAAPAAPYNSETTGLRVLATGVQVVKGNIIHDIGSASLGAPAANNNMVWGLFVSGTAVGTVVEKNVVYNIYGSSAGTGARADIITLLQSGSGASATYSNNMLSGADLSGSSDRFITGIHDLSVSPAAAGYFNNTVQIYGIATGSNNTYAFRRSGTTHVDIRNNIFSNTRSGGSGFHVAIANTNASTTGWPATASDYNNLYSTNSSHVAQWLGSTASNNRDLAGWQMPQDAGTPGSGGDLNSVSIPPVFVSNTDLHLTTANYLLDNLGIPAGGVTDDIDEELRDETTPDVGADEFVSVHPCPGFDDIVYVDASATGANDGTSWADAYTSLQDAIVIACSCPVVSQIWVAAGTYYPDEGAGQTNNLRTSTFQLCNGIAIYGGFNGTESDLSERDWQANETILNGDIDQNSALTNNAYHVVTGSLTNNTAILDGFKVTGGNANGGGADNNGGGMVILNGSPVLGNMVFTGNHANTLGGAIHNSSSSPMILNSVFTLNTSNVVGGAINAQVSSHLTLIDCDFISNTGNINGGAIALSSSNPVVTNCRFIGNSSQEGGGLYAFNMVTTLTNCLFSGNRATNRGAALHLTTNANSTLVNCTISGNMSTGNGGGILLWNTPNLNLVNTIIWNNQAAGSTTSTSASIFNDNSVAKFAYSLVANSGGSGSWNPAIGTDLGNNIDVNPVFVLDINPALAPTTAGDLQLQSSSPAIDAGNNASNSEPYDLDGLARIVGDAIDIGAYEHQQEPIDCVVSEWSAWSACNAECGPGLRCRTRTVLVEPNEFGLSCPPLEECEPCNNGPCYTCDDNIMNGFEEGIDCGGPDCGPCGPPDAVCGVFTVYVDSNDPVYDGPGLNNIWWIPSEDLDAGSESDAIAPTLTIRRHLSSISFDWTTQGACIDATPNGGALSNADKGTVYRACLPVRNADFNTWRMYQLRIQDQFGSDACIGMVKVVPQTMAYSAPSVHYVITAADQDDLALQESNDSRTDVHTEQKEGVTIFPNPGNEFMHVEWFAQANEQMRLRITDLSGQTIAFQDYSVVPGLNQVLVDMSSYPSGMYLVQLQSDRLQEIRKWMKATE